MSRTCPGCGIQPISELELRRYGLCEFCRYDGDEPVRITRRKVPPPFPPLSSLVEDVHPAFLDLLDAWQVEWRPVHGMVRVRKTHGDFFIQVATKSVKYLARACWECPKVCERYRLLCVYPVAYGWAGQPGISQREIETLALTYALIMDEFDDVVRAQLRPRCQGPRSWRPRVRVLRPGGQPEDPDPESARIYSLLLDPTTRAIYECMKARHPASLLEMARLLRISPTTVQSRLRELFEAGIVPFSR